VSTPAAALAGQVRHVAALVADAIGQAQLDHLPVPAEVLGVQATLLAWVRQLEQGKE
jgi:hypothetical protein